MCLAAVGQQPAWPLVFHFEPATSFVALRGSPGDKRVTVLLFFCVSISLELSRPGEPGSMGALTQVVQLAPGRCFLLFIPVLDPQAVACTGPRHPCVILAAAGSMRALTSDDTQGPARSCGPLPTTHQELLQSNVGHSRGELLPPARETLFATRGADAWHANAPEKTVGCLGSATSFSSMDKRLSQQFPFR